MSTSISSLGGKVFRVEPNESYPLELAPDANLQIEAHVWMYWTDKAFNSEGDALFVPDDAIALGEALVRCGRAMKEIS